MPEYLSKTLSEIERWAENTSAEYVPDRSLSYNSQILRALEAIAGYTYTANRQLSYDRQLLNVLEHIASGV
jgi:hypothetical protein